MNGTRVTLDLSPEDYRKLDDLVDWTGSQTKAETIRRSIRREHTLRELAQRGGEPPVEIYRTAFAL